MKLVDELREQYPTKVVCNALDVPRSTYYYRRSVCHRSDPERDQLRQMACDVFRQCRQSAGARTIAGALCDAGHAVGRFLAGRLMREAGLVSTQRPRHRYKAGGQEAQVAPNHLNRAFCVEQANTVWTGDITYIWAGTCWLYLAVVLDLYRRRVVGWSTSRHPNSELTCKALRTAFESRGRPSSVMFHSDQGCQYTSEEYQSTLTDYGMTPSMSRRGNCWDNAPTERFFRSLKSEWMPSKGYSNYAAAEADVLRYATLHYNHFRPHSYNGYRPPALAEEQI